MAISQRASSGWSLKPISLAQVTRSAAARMISSQAALARSVTGQVAQPGGFGFTDAVLDAGMLAVAQFQPGDLPGHDTGLGVGDERGDPHAVGVGEPQLRAGVRAFFTQDQPGSGRPGGQVDQVGGLGDPGPVTDTAVGVDRRVPAIAEVEGVHGVLHA